MKMRFLALALLLAACVPQVEGDPPPGAPQPGDLVSDTSGESLLEREPDLCRASDYQQYVGQPQSVVSTLVITREYRVVEFGGIVSQEYNPSRLNFRLSPEGAIVRVDCG